MQSRSTPSGSSPSRKLQPLLDKHQIASLLDTTPRHIERLVEDGRLGHCRVGRFIRFDIADVERYLTDNHVSPRQREL